MSSSGRATSKGGKAKGDTNKSHKHDKSDTGKGNGDKQQHSGGGGESARSKNDDPSIKEKVRQIMDMTRRSEEEVCLALHECDNDTQCAINMLFESMVEGEWETSSKKKRNRQASASKPEAEENAPVTEWEETPPPQTTDKEKPRNKNASGNGPPRLHGRHNDNRGWKGRENKENERNLEEGGQQHERKERRGRGGHMRGGGLRGRGGGRPGLRYPRNNRNNFSGSRTIDTWDNSTSWEGTTITNSSHTTNFAEENWDDFPQADDWSTEEYTGSLADTKVFTPSVSVTPQLDHNAEPKAVSTPVVSLEPMQPIVNTLTAAQKQYLNQLTQQTTDDLKVTQPYVSGHPSQPYNSTQQPYNSGQTYVNNGSSGSQQYNSNSQQYASANTYNNANYNVNSNYGNANDPPVQTQKQTNRTKTQRARVPPPSKIPASAVEMPGEFNSSIAYLDVQFGVMDFMSDGTTFDATADTKYSPTSDLGNSSQTQNSNLEINQANQNATIDAYATSKQNAQSSISSALSQSLTNTDTIPQTSEHLPGSYNTVPRSSTTAANATQTASTPAGLDLNKQTDSHSYTQSSTYNSYQPKTTTAYQSQNYNSSNYNSTQTTSNSYVNNTPSYNTPNVATNTYQNSYSSATSYQTNSNSAGAFPTISQANSYPTSNQYHQQTSQSVYGTNSALSNSSNYGNTPSGNQYNYSTNSNKLVKDTTYENSTTSVSSTITTTSSVNSSTLSQTTTTGTKSTISTLAKNTNNVMSNMPPAGVAPVMSTQYMIGQVPYFQQPIYSFEDMQLLQQRIPHMTTGYYDMSYQTPTTLAAVRDGTLANVAYSISDGRFTRGDNNTSPVPSTLSQQTSTLTQGHQAQPMLAAQTGATPFFYAPYNPMQPTYQFGAVYPQLPTVTNAHGSTNNQYPKQATYGSGYGSGYDQLSQSQDYTKGGYVGNTQGQNKGSGANASSGGSSANDLTAMYGKSHTALGKVNSYDKQGFHSGTPPPFTGTLHGNQSTGLAAASGNSYGAQMFIPTMAAHQQHHSTQLIHQPLHQMEVRHQGRRMDTTNSTGQRSQASSQAKSGGKQGYPNSYWNQA